MMGWDTVTVWRRSGGSWERVVATGVRVEDGASSSEAAVGPSSTGGLRVYLFRDLGIRTGDYVAVGAVGGAEPTEGARLVTGVKPWTMRHVHHHTEVTCS